MRISARLALALGWISLTLLALAVPAGASAADPGQLSLEVLSSRPDMVSDDDSLVEVRVPASERPGDLAVTVNGTDRTSAFSPVNGDPRRLRALLGGLTAGPNTVQATIPGQPTATLALVDHPRQGPIFSGPRQSPYVCTTASNGLGSPTDTSTCSAATQVAYYYKSTDGTFHTLANPASRPADLTQTTTREGRTVDYVVRVESGVIDRSIYRWAVLAPGGVTADGWNHRLIYFFGGGCSAGYQQGSSSIASVLDDRMLSRGYSVLGSSLNVLNTACNDVLSAEAASMVKEHVIESLGEPPAWTMGWGGSGGSVQQQMIAQNYPGILDGLVPAASFPDNSASDYPDCRLLVNYFGTSAGASLTPAQRSAITGLSDPNGCNALSAGADVVRASEGCDESVVGVANIFDPISNPDGARCTIWDSMINVYGADPATGYARRTLDNVGVQYGLKALQEGSITVAQFLDLNQAIGGFDNNGDLRAQRSVADSAALATAYRTGRINQGTGGYPDVPVIDIRTYTDDEVNVHQYFNTYRMRARLDRFGGDHDNQVMFRAKGGTSVNRMQDAAIDTMGTWLDSVAADNSGLSRAQKVVVERPANAVDACWVAGNRIDEPATLNGTGTCSTTYPAHSLPANRAGKPVESIVAKCQLKPIDFGDYPAMSAAQQSQMQAIYPGGICDWTKAGVGEQPLAGTWQTFVGGSDSTPPDTTISSGPASTVSVTSVGFGFSGTETGVRFECSLDGSAFSACQSPTTLSSLSLGAHTFRVRAIDPAGNPDPTPASRTFTVTTDTAPTITTVSPGAGAGGVARTAAVVAVFDQPMNKLSAEAAFSLKRTSDGASVSGSFAWFGNALVFLPSAPLANGTSYTATESAAAVDDTGNSLPAARSWQFTTATQPLITQSSPGDGAGEVLPNTYVWALFDTAMDKASTQGALSLKRTSDGARVSGQFIWFGNLLLFKPCSDLAGGTQYTAAVSTSAKDVAGHALPAARSWRFTTTNRPIVDSVTPADGTTGAARSAATTVAFNKAMDKTSAQGAFSLKRTSTGAAVGGTFSWSGNTMRFTPSSALAANAQYTAAVAGTAKDQGGTTLANPTVWKYVTAG